MAQDEAAGRKTGPWLHFHAGAVGFVFYEESPHPGVTDEKTYAFGSIQEAADWLVSQFTEAPRTDTVEFRPLRGGKSETFAGEAANSSFTRADRSERFRAAECALTGGRWSPAEAHRLRELIHQGEVADIRNS